VIAARLMAMVRSAFGLELSARAVFLAPTAAELARTVEARLASDAEEVRTMPERAGDEESGR
jgi:hypothetical protein